MRRAREALSRAGFIRPLARQRGEVLCGQWVQPQVHCVVRGDGGSYLL